MERLNKCFTINEQEIVSFIGSGGKTSLMWYLANCYRKEKVLVTTTTKIGLPLDHFYDFFYSEKFSTIGKNQQGITLAGTMLKNQNKLSAPVQVDIEKTFSSFDKIFIEADGSKQLPLKGWETFEPVVIPKTTMTIGIVPVSVINQKVSHLVIHRLPLFMQATGVSEGDYITEETVAKIITNPNGLLEKCRGEKIVCLSQVETFKELKQAEKIVEQLPSDILEQIGKVIATSIKSETGTILWEK